MTRKGLTNHRLKPEGAVPNWLRNEEQHMKIKNELKLLDYQISFYTKEIKRIQKAWDNLRSGEERRKVSYGLKYDSRKALDDAYLLGGMTDREYMRQRSALWTVYSDRGYKMRLEWLNGELEKVQNRKNRIEEWMEQTRQEKKKQYYRRSNNKWKKNTRNRKRKQRLRKQALEERWKKYGIG